MIHYWCNSYLTICSVHSTCQHGDVLFIVVDMVDVFLVASLSLTFSDTLSTLDIISLLFAGAIV